MEEISPDNWQSAVVQITPPNAAGFCSLGIAIDVACEALEQSSIRVGEINTQIPRTFYCLSLICPISSVQSNPWARSLLNMVSLTSKEAPSQSGRKP